MNIECIDEFIIDNLEELYFYDFMFIFNNTKYLLEYDGKQHFEINKYLSVLIEFADLLMLIINSWYCDQQNKLVWTKLLSS